MDEFDKRKALVTAAVGLALLAGAVALVGRIAEYDELLRALRRADKLWFPLCLLGELLAYAGYIVAYRSFARVDGGPRFSLWTVTQIVGIGFGAFVAGSTVGGLAVDYWAIHRTGMKPHDAARRVLALNTLEWAVLGTFATAAAIAVLLGRGEGAPQGMTLGWIVTVPACVGAALWVSSPRRAERLTSIHRGASRVGTDPRTWLRWTAEKLRNGLADAIGGVVVVRHVVSRPFRYPGAVLGHPVYWLGTVLTLYAALRAFGVHVLPSPLMLAFTTGYVLTALPLPAGGAGGVEVALALTLHAVGVPLAPALLGVLVYRFFTLWLPIAPALLLLPRLQALNEQLPRVPHGQD